MGANTVSALVPVVSSFPAIEYTDAGQGFVDRPRILINSPIGEHLYGLYFYNSVSWIFLMNSDVAQSAAGRGQLYVYFNVAAPVSASSIVYKNGIMTNLTGIPANDTSSYYAAVIKSASVPVTVVM